MSGSISRRNFLKGTAVGAGALAIGASGASILATPRKAHAATRLGYLPTTSIDRADVIRNVWKWYCVGGG